MTKKIKDYEYKRADIDAAKSYLQDCIARAKNAASGKELAALRDEANGYFAKIGRASCRERV